MYSVLLGLAASEDLPRRIPAAPPGRGSRVCKARKEKMVSRKEKIKKRFGLILEGGEGEDVDAVFFSLSNGGV